MVYIDLDYLESTCGPITGDLTMKYSVNARNFNIIQTEVQATRLGEVEGKLMEAGIPG